MFFSYSFFLPTILFRFSGEYSFHRTRHFFLHSFLIVSLGILFFLSPILKQFYSHFLNRQNFKTFSHTILQALIASYSNEPILFCHSLMNFILPGGRNKTTPNKQHFFHFLNFQTNRCICVWERFYTKFYWTDISRTTVFKISYSINNTELLLFVS